MRDEPAGIQASGFEGLEQERDRIGIHKPGSQRDVLDPQNLDVELYGLTMHAYVGDVASRLDDTLADVEGVR